MKVLLLNQIPEVANKYTFSLARGLKRNGVDVIVCGIEDDDVSRYQDVPFLNMFGCYSRERNPLRKLVTYKKSWEKIVDYCLLEHVDIVHVQWYIFSPMDWEYHQKLRKKGIKVLTTIHDLLPFDKKFYDFYYHKKIYSHSDMVISQAKINETELINTYHVHKKKIVYIPHGHYMEFSETAGKEESIRYLSLPSDRPIILFFGQIKKVKGVDVLIKAMKRVVDSYPDVLCIIAGKVWKDDFSSYQGLIEELKLKNNIRTDIKFIPDDEIKYYFNAADIVALPYRQIYQSGVVLLAAAYEKPIVATTEGEFLNVIKNHETGLLVESGNDEEFADALMYYLHEPGKANEMAMACKRDLMDRLSWDAIAKQIMDVYEKIVLSSKGEEHDGRIEYNEVKKKE